MSTGKLSLDLDAVAANWRALDAMTDCETAAVVKADGYGLGAGVIANKLAGAGARQFFVAVAEEGAALRQALGEGPTINVFSGHVAGDSDLLRSYNLVPMINSIEQMQRHIETLSDHRFGLQLDSGMNRLGIEPNEWAAMRDIVLRLRPTLLMSHLACADERSHPMNNQQQQAFFEMTADLDVPRSLAATGGMLLSDRFHFDLCRPGIGLYGGAPFSDAQPVVKLDLPVIQIRDVAIGEPVGYGNAWTARRPSKIATVSGGYADGLIRAMGAGVQMWHGDQPCPVVGRVSMDLITVDVTDAIDAPEMLSILGPHQGVDQLASCAGTIGYEILTSLGARYARNTVITESEAAVA
jgi:alanine racemase